MKSLKKVVAGVVALALAGALAGCLGKGPDDIAAVDRAQPKHGYRLIVDTSAAPGEPKGIQGHAIYQNVWSGEACMSSRMARWGVPMPWPQRALPLKRTAPGIYEGVFYLDRLQDAAYFGRGLCAWRLNAVGVTFRGEGGQVYGVGIGYPQVKPGGSDLAYYRVDSWKEKPPVEGIEGAMAVATDDFKPDLKNAYVNDRTKYFPLRAHVEPLPGSPGLGVREEYRQRTGQDLE